MEYRETVICRIMLLAHVDRQTAERRIEAYTSGRIGRRELYAPPGAPPAESAPAPEAPPSGRRAKRLPKSRPRGSPRRDVPAPRPYRSSGTARLNMEALGDAARMLTATWPDHFYDRDALQATLQRFERWIMVQQVLAAHLKKTPPD